MTNFYQLFAVILLVNCNHAQDNSNTSVKLADEPSKLLVRLLPGQHESGAELEESAKERRRKALRVSTALANVSTSTQYPSMSPERRKAYNSIRDREQYFRGRQRRLNDQQGQRNHHEASRRVQKSSTQKTVDTDTLETQETAHRAHDIPKQSVINNRYYEFGVKLPKEISTKLTKLEPWIGTTSVPGDMENFVMPVGHQLPLFEEKIARLSTIKEVLPLPLSGDTRFQYNENNKRILSEMSKQLTLTSTEMPSTLPSVQKTSPNLTSFSIKVPIMSMNTSSNSSLWSVNVPFSKDAGIIKLTKNLSMSTEPHATSEFSSSTEHVPSLTHLTPTFIKVFVTSSTEETPTDTNNASDVGIVVSVVDEEPVLGDNTSGIAVYLLAGFGLVPMIIAIVFGVRYYMARTKRKSFCESLEENVTVPHVPHLTHRSGLRKTPSNATTITLVHAPRLPRVQQKCTSWELGRQQLTLLSIIGHGNFGQVWKAELLESIGTTPRLVAVKTVKEGATEKEQDELIKELHVMQQIGHHPNVVTLLGCCTEKEPYYVIMEYVQFGKLLTYLREHRSEDNYSNFSTDSSVLVAKDLTSFMYCIARGMEYLSSKKIIHRDLAARNVLLDQHKICKIADFGMSRLVTADDSDGEIYEERHHKGALPIRWMSPESLQYSVFTHASDVWSFGIVLWEIVTLGSTPYPSLSAREVVQGVRNGLRPQRPRHVRPELWRLAARCWHVEPTSRPIFSELRSALATMLDGRVVDLDSFAEDNRFQLHARTGPSGRNKHRISADSKGTITLVGNGSFTVNSNILDNKQFTMV